MNHKKYDIYGFRIKPKKSKNIYSKNNIDKYKETKKTFTILGLVCLFIFILFCIFLALLSGYISWNCYANDLKNIRIIKTIFAVLFFYFYLPYFVVLRIFLKVPCL
jgi:cytochrome b subunit of formate dehydrogenase